MNDFERQMCREQDGFFLLENIADFIQEDVRVGQIISILLNHDDDLFTIENSVLLERIRKLRNTGASND